MSPSFYYVLHVLGLALMLASAFYAFAGPAPATKKRVMMFSGIGALLMLIAGVGLMHKMGYEWSSGWVWVKIACFAGLSALPGIAYRRRERAGSFAVISIGLILLALVMVYYKPF